MPWSLTLGKSRIGVHKPEGKDNRDGDPQQRDSYGRWAVLLTWVDRAREVA